MTAATEFSENKMTEKVIFWYLHAMVVAVKHTTSRRSVDGGGLLIPFGEKFHLSSLRRQRLIYNKFIC